MCKSKRGKVSAVANSNILCSIPSDPPSCASIPMFINSKTVTVHAMIDSGSCVSFIHPNTVNKLKLKVLPSKEKISMASSPFSSYTLGHCIVQLNAQDNHYPDFKLSILPNLCYEIILGQDFMKLHKEVSFHLQGSEPKLSVCGVSAMNMEPPSLFPVLSDDCKPISTPSRKFSNPDTVFIKEEVKTLLKEGIIEKSVSPWRAQVIVTHDERHRRRMVVDYSATINRFTSLDAYPMPRINDLVQELAKYNYFSKLDLKSAYYQVPIGEDEKMYTAFEADGQLLQYTRIPFGLTNSVAVFQRIMNSLIEDNSLSGTFCYLYDIIVCGKTEEDHDSNLKKFMQMKEKYNLTLNESKCSFNKTEITYLGYSISKGSLKPDSERLAPLRNLNAPLDKAALRRALGLFSYYSHWIPQFSKKIAPLLTETKFPMCNESLNAFSDMKNEICSAALAAFDEDQPICIETDASATSIAGCLSQNGRPVAFFSKTLCESGRTLRPAVEREAVAIIECVRKWRNFLVGRRFTILTDQQAVSFMFNAKHTSKIKNDKILRWRIELSGYQFDIQYRRGDQNFCADTLSRACALNTSSLAELHESLCHPGVARLYHFVKSRNLNFSIEEVRKTCSQCSICAEIKPRFFHPPKGQLIKASRPLDRLSIDFVGPKPSVTRNKYLLVMVDEYSRFPFVFPCPDVTAKTVVSCFMDLFSLIGCPASVHSDRGAQFLSTEVTQFLQNNGVALTHSSPYHPIGNGQCERYNGIIWKAIQLCLRSRKLSDSYWESSLNFALHAVRSLLCTSTNETPHDRFFSFPRRSATGYSFPNWLKPGPVLLRKFVRHCKSDPLVERVQLVTVSSPHYARVRFEDGRESTVSTSDLAPPGSSSGGNGMCEDEAV